ncbi:DUF3556 domain-containing protein [Jatrophihabitans fulvus]
MSPTDHTVSRPDTTPPCDDWSALGHHARLAASVERRLREGAVRPPGTVRSQLGRLTAFAAGGLVVVSLGGGLDAAARLGTWWDEPVTLQKLAVWTLLWQLLGLGRGLAPHGIGALPPVAGLSYWLTPGTMRLPAFPRLPLTGGTRRTVADVALYAAVLALTAGLLGVPHADRATLPRAGVVLLLAALAVLGLRDRTPLHALCPELTLPLLVAFAIGADDPARLAAAVTVALVGTWWTTAAVRAGRHFPFAVATALTDAPWSGALRLRPRAWQRDERDVVPGDLPRVLARTLVVAGGAVPVALVLGRGGVVTTVALAVAAVVLALPTSALARGSRPEATAFLLFATVVVFGRWAPPSADALDGPVAVMAAATLALVVASAIAPRRTSLLSALRHRAGDGPTSTWLFRADVAARFDVPVHDVAPTAGEVLHHRDHAHRLLHPNGRALDGLLVRAVDDLTRFRVRSAEFVAGAAVGWAPGTGPSADRLLLAAVQERCGFAPGELRVVSIDARPLGRHEQRYRILDAADGLLEAGVIDVDDAVDRVPWRDPHAPAIPVEVSFSAVGDVGYHSPAEFDFLHGARAARASTGAAMRPVPTGMGAAVTSAVTGHRPTPGPAARPRPRPTPERSTPRPPAPPIDVVATGTPTVTPSPGRPVTH